MPLLKIGSLLFIILALATLVSHALIPRYQQDGPELLTNHWDTKVAENSGIDIKEGELIISSSNLQMGASAHQDIPQVVPGTILKLSAEMKCEDVVAGKKPWNRARLMLVQNNGKRNRWDLPHTITLLTGTHDWESHHSFFTIDLETQKIRITAELSRSTGLLRVKNIHLYALSETPAFTWARNIILSAWGVFFLVLIGSCLFMGRKTVIARALLVSVFVSIILGTTLPGDIKDKVSNEIKTQIHAEDQLFKAVVPWDLTKVGHFCFFFLLGLILCLMMTKEPLIQGLIIMLLLAGGTEFAQFYIEGRTPLVSDFFIDAAGGVAGIILIRFFSMYKNTGHFENS